MIIISLNMRRAAHDRLHKEKRLRAADLRYRGVVLDAAAEGRAGAGKRPPL